MRKRILIISILITAVVLLPLTNFVKEKEAEGQKKLNRLAKEKSPYLLQHADNPVDWYPWAEEAFERARKENKPIFLSIGYSTCHWCHVMEHESFEDSLVASLMNKYFVSIKVDREERPDIDNIYMTVCQMMTGSGGWPLTVIMTPDKKPFFAGTYFPKESSYGRIGMVDLIPRLGDVWLTKTEQVDESADKVVQYLKNAITANGSKSLGEEHLNAAFTTFFQTFDSARGGVQGQRKFPTSHNFSFLLRYWKRTQDPAALLMVEKSLQEMRKGGIYDHIGFGFHRYSTDPEWRLPHFEKMLYDQAINAIAYVEAYQATKKEEYAATAREIFTYVLRDMTSPEGGFYSAQDADSEGEEGRFYLWTPEEIKKVLGKEEGDFFCEVFNVSDDGNYTEEATRRRTGRNVLYLTATPAELAKKYGMSEVKFRERVESARKRLFDEREKRAHPAKDDKILTDWNGLMIAALARGAQAFDDLPAFTPLEGKLAGNPYAESAKKSVDFILTHLRTKEGKLLKMYREGAASIPAHLDDYAFFVWGLLELYEATFDVSYLKHALDLNDKMIKLFWDNENGGFFFTEEGTKGLIIRTKEMYDGAIPSGNSVAALNLLRFSRITGNPQYENMAQTIGQIFSDRLETSPTAFSQLLMSVDFALGPSYEIVIVGKSEDKNTQAMLKFAQQQFLPNKVLIFKPLNESSPVIETLAPFTKPQGSIEGKATAYVCQNYTCKAPTTDLKVMKASFQNDPADVRRKK